MAIARSSITINYHETATNSITDLTGTKWLLNSELTLSPLSSGQRFEINYTSNQINLNYIGINYAGDSPEPRADLYLMYGNDEYPVYSDGWQDESYRTISITGGTDATNADLIAWLQSNATQIQDEPTNPISIGNLPIVDMYFGTQQVKKVYLGNALVWEAGSEPTPTVMPSKGDIITLDGGTARYRVLKTNGTVAEVLALDDVATSTFNSSSVTTTFSDGSVGQKYEGSTLDTYMNSTFYNSLSTNIKNAIVQKAITQSFYQFNTSSVISEYDFKIQGKGTGGTYWYKRKGQVSVGNRYCYALDLDDVAEYLNAGSGNTVTGYNLNKMFFETSVIDKSVWLDSACSATATTYALHVYGYKRLVDLIFCDYSYIARPAFQVDLSKVSWVKE